MFPANESPLCFAVIERFVPSFKSQLSIETKSPVADSTSFFLSPVVTVISVYFLSNFIVIFVRYLSRVTLCPLPSYLNSALYLYPVQLLDVTSATYVVPFVSFLSAITILFLLPFASVAVAYEVTSATSLPSLLFLTESP